MWSNIAAGLARRVVERHHGTSGYPLSDAFTRARADISGTKADTGQTWVNIGGQLQASGGTASPTADANSFVYAAVGTAGLLVEIEFATMNQVQGMYLLNRSPDQNDGVMVVARNNPIAGYHETWVYDEVGGVPTRVDDGSIPLPNPGQFVGVQIIGSDAHIFFDGTLVKVVALSGPKPTATSYGFGVEYSNQCPTITTTKFGQIRAKLPASQFVSPTLGSVVVSPSSATIAGVGTQQLTGTPKDTNGNPFNGATLAWSSSNTGVATVDQNGLVTSTGVGSATITCTASGIGGPVSATCAITVTAVVGSITITPSTASLMPAGTQQLSATATDTFGNTMAGQTFTWASNNTGIATVDSSGLVTAVAAGSANITATDSGVSGTCAVTVTTSGGLTVNLAALPDLARQFPIYADGSFTYPGLSLTRGQTYTDPHSSQVVTKLSDPNWPAANTGFYPDYAGIWCGISNAWGNGHQGTVIGRLENGGGFWLIDFDLSQATATSRVSNGRVCVKQPALDTCSQFSPVAGEAQILYVFSGDRKLYRIDTSTNLVAPIGNHPAGGKDFNAFIDVNHLGVDLQCSDDGRFFSILSTAYDNILLWDTQTDKIYELPTTESSCHGHYLSPDGLWVMACWDGGGLHSGNTGSIFDVAQILSGLGGQASPISVPSAAPYKFDVDTIVDTAHTAFAISSDGTVFPAKRNDSAATLYYNPATETRTDNGIALSDVRNPNQDHFATQWRQPTRPMGQVMVLASNYAGDRITPDINGWSVQQGAGANTIYKCTVDYTGGGNNQSAFATSTIAQTNFKVLHKSSVGRYVGNAKTFSDLTTLAAAIGNGTTDVTAYDTANGTVIAQHGACALDHATGTWYQWQPGGADPTGFADAFAPMGLELGVGLVSCDGTVAKFIAHSYTYFKVGSTYGENYWAATHGNQSHDGRFVGWASSQGTQDTQGESYRIDWFITELPMTGYTPTPTSITISPAGPFSLPLSNTQQLSATVFDQFGFAMTGQTVTWSTSDATVATVNSSGLVTPVGDGTCNITAADGAATNSVSVTVTSSGGPVTDAFNRADNTVLGNADTGQAWTAQNGTWGISGNQAYCASATGVNFATIDCGTADLTVTVSMPTLDSAAGLVVRYTDPNHYIAMRARVGDSWYLYANNGGGETVISSLNLTPVAGDRIALVLSGSTITPKVNGTSYTPVTNTTNQTATQHGIMVSNTNVPRWDDFDAR